MILLGSEAVSAVTGGAQAVKPLSALYIIGVCGDRKASAKDEGAIH